MRLTIRLNSSGSKGKGERVYEACYTGYYRATYRKKGSGNIKE
jgi:hypothetical protein